MEVSQLKPQAPVEKQSVTRPLATTLAVLAGIIRVVPHPWNFTPVGALCLYSGARLRSWQAWVIPLAVMALSDLAIKSITGDPGLDPFVYASFLINILLGRWLLRTTESPWRIGSVSLLASLQFFLVTNFGAWVMLSKPPFLTYSPTWDGLVQCYVMGLPFADRTFLGDLLFCGVLFGLHALLSRWVFSGERVTAVPSGTAP
jgi:hypothetical protein